MILTKSTKMEYRLDVNKGLFTRICKELQTKGKINLSVTSLGEDMVASSVVEDSSNNRYIVNICMCDRKINAIFIEPDTASIRYYTDLRTYKTDALGELVKCNNDDMNKYIDDFIREVISMCR